ncbi:hypothetical protein KC19_VG021400 [Ceratodon purpureus]|uniref:Uncharacterized protein n=1 Tax=Ceratodon purpureus TaxID=3225 RepID=A0A8T0HLD6_CERPU|nr:hypothetical protein KC19_VG021400 [Ceratodon purpureus]
MDPSRPSSNPRNPPGVTGSPHLLNAWRHDAVPPPGNGMYRSRSPCLSPTSTSSAPIPSDISNRMRFASSLTQSPTPVDFNLVGDFNPVIDRDNFPRPVENLTFSIYYFFFFEAATGEDPSAEGIFPFTIFRIMNTVE